MEPAPSRDPGAPPSLTSLLAQHRHELRRIVERHGAGLLRFESADDLVQGVQLQAIEERERFAFRGEGQFLGWLTKVAQQHIANRHRYWTALRRNAGRVMRLQATASLSAEARAGARMPAGTGTSPLTAAFRREQIEMATCALAALFPRDQELVRWIADDLSIEDIAERMGISPVAAKSARIRALERFRKTFEIVTRRDRQAREGT